MLYAERVDTGQRRTKRGRDCKKAINRRYTLHKQIGWRLLPVAPYVDRAHCILYDNHACARPRAREVGK